MQNQYAKRHLVPVTTKSGAKGSINTQTIPPGAWTRASGKLKTATGEDIEVSSLEIHFTGQSTILRGKGASFSGSQPEMLLAAEKIIKAHGGKVDLPTQFGYIES